MSNAHSDFVYDANRFPEHEQSMLKDPRFQHPQQTYWQQSHAERTTLLGRQRVTFADIMNNLSVEVDPKGVVRLQQQRSGHQPQEDPQLHADDEYVPPPQEELEQPLQYSYIHNKYFKDFIQAKHQQQSGGKKIHRPQTFLELYDALEEEKLAAARRRRELQRTRSTKIHYSTPEGDFVPLAVQPAPLPVIARPFSLRSMSFH